jgi:hypothetical protein
MHNPIFLSWLTALFTEPAEPVIEPVPEPVVVLEPTPDPVLVPEPSPEEPLSESWFVPPEQEPAIKVDPIIDGIKAHSELSYKLTDEERDLAYSLHKAWISPKIMNLVGWIKGTFKKRHIADVEKTALYLMHGLRHYTGGERIKTVCVAARAAVRYGDHPDGLKALRQKLYSHLFLSAYLSSLVIIDCPFCEAKFPIREIQQHLCRYSYHSSHSDCPGKSSLGHNRWRACECGKSFKNSIMLHSHWRSLLLRGELADHILMARIANGGVHSNE